MTEKKFSSKNIYYAIREMILNFELYPGSRITEGELATHFGVSRTPVREAMQRLATEGYLTLRPKQGGYIRPIDIEEITDYYQVRIALEALALELACIYMSDTKIRALAEAWNPETIKPLSPAEMEAFEESFHLALAEASGNRAICNYLESINHRIRPIRRYDFTQPERVERTYKEHYQILQHLLNRDLQAAQTCMRAHIQSSEQVAKSLTLIQLARMGARRQAS